MRPLLIAILYFVGVLTIAHFYAPPGYVWSQNTISELASQGHVYKWIMQAGFVGFGILLTVGLALKSYSLGKIEYPDGLILAYGLSILITGIFCAAPFDSRITFSAQEAQIHSLFATTAGFALVGGILGYMITSPEKRTLQLVFLVMITGFSLLFGFSAGGTIPIGKGIVQRSLYLVSFIWLAIL